MLGMNVPLCDCVDLCCTATLFQLHSSAHKIDCFTLAVSVKMHSVFQ